MAKPAPSSRIQVRISMKDREMLEALAEEGGTTLSEVVRQWVAERCRLARTQQANMRAVTMMEGFFGTLGTQMIEEGHADAAEAFFGLRDGTLPGPIEVPQTGTRSSNTGSTVSKVRQTPPSGGLKK